MPISYEADIAHIKETKYLEDKPSRRFLDYWFQINDGLIPNFVTREEYDKKRKSSQIFEPGGGNTTLINIPADLQMWEIFDFIRLIDIDTFQNYPHKAKEERERLSKIISSYRNMGIYLKTYIEEIDWGEDKDAEQLARDLATEFYRFSRYIKFRSRRDVSYQIIPTNHLDGEYREEDEEVMKEVEQEMMGSSFVKKRYDRLQRVLGEEPDLGEIDEERKKIILLYFKGLVREKSAEIDFKEEISAQERSRQDLSWNQYVENFLGVSGEVDEATKERLEEQFLLEKPWERSGPAFALQQSTQLGLYRTFTRPQAELERAIARRGKQKIKEGLKEAETGKSVVTRIAEKVGINFEKDRKNLAEKLNLTDLKDRLEKVRNEGDLEKIAKVELEVVNKIQKEISKYQYEEKNSLPVWILNSEKVNCVGATLLSSALFEEVGINYFEISITEHSIVIVKTSNGVFHYRDMRHRELNRVLSDDELGEGNLEKLEQYSISGEDKPLSLDVDLDWYNQISFGYGKRFALKNFDVIKPQHGIDHGLLNNLYYALRKDVENNFESRELIQEVLIRYLDQFPDSWDVLITYVGLEIEMGNYEEAKFALYRFGQAVEDSGLHYSLWGDVFYEEGRYEFSLESYRKAIIAYPKVSDNWQGVVNCLTKLERNGEKRVSLEQAIRFTEDDTFREQLIELYKGSNEMEKAIIEYEKFIDQYPEDVELWIDYYSLLFYEEPEETNARLVLSMLDKHGMEEEMVKVIKYAQVNNYDNGEWINTLIEEFDIQV